MPTTVRITLFPDPIEVPDDEVAVLRAQGLLVEAADQAPVPPAADAAPRPPKETTR